MSIRETIVRIATEHETRDPYQICRNLDISILRHPLIDIRGYYLGVADISIIVLAENLSENAARFVCAHELGHGLLHGGLNRFFMDTRTFMVASKYETEADAFACGLLFGELPFSQEKVVSIREISDCLGVPVSRSEQRLSEIMRGII